MAIIMSAQEIQYTIESLQGFKGPDVVTGEWKKWQGHLDPCPLLDLITQMQATLLTV
jgi:hypothetical protein